MRVFVTKYALTRGIIEVTAEPSEVYEDVVRVRVWGDSYLHKPDWHTTRKAAVARAEEMRLRKIASLKRKIEKLDKLTFE